MIMKTKKILKYHKNWNYIVFILFFICIILTYLNKRYFYLLLSIIGLTSSIYYYVKIQKELRKLNSNKD